jgi:hypothetical protein
MAKDNNQRMAWCPSGNANLKFCLHNVIDENVGAPNKSGSYFHSGEGLYKGEGSDTGNVGCGMI